MRTFFYLVVILFLWIETSSAQALQCSRTSILQKGGYEISGRAYLEEFDDGSIKLRLDDDFATDPGPDVQVFLSNDSVSIANALMVQDIGTQVDGINHFSGAITFDIPSEININQYQYIVFRCVQFNVHWASGHFGATDCPPSSCTENSIIVNASPEEDTTIRAMDTIATSGEVIITKNVIFQAGQNITLTSGFHATAGPNFLARIAACSTLNKVAPIAPQKNKLKVDNFLSPKQPLTFSIAPNPIVNYTILTYELPTSAVVNLALYNMQGKLVRSLINNQYLSSGQTQIRLDISKQESGLYFLGLNTQSDFIMKKIMILN